MSTAEPVWEIKKRDFDPFELLVRAIDNLEDLGAVVDFYHACHNYVLSTCDHNDEVLFSITKDPTCACGVGIPLDVIRMAWMSYRIKRL
jgi:hypothetical protein